MIIEANKNSFKKYVNEVTTSNVFGTAYKIIRKKRRMNVIENTKKSDGSFTSEYYESKKEILRYHFPYEDGTIYDFKNSLTSDYYERESSQQEMEIVAKEIKVKEKKRKSMIT